MEGILGFYYVKPPNLGPLLELEFRTNEPHPKAVPHELEISGFLSAFSDT